MLKVTNHSKQQLPMPSPTFNNFTSPAYYGAVTKEPPHTLLYLPVIILTLTDKFTNLMCQQQDTSHHKQYMHRGIQTDIVTPLWRNKLELEHKLNSNTLIIHSSKVVITRPPELHFYHLLYNLTITRLFIVQIVM